jgi:hypothetical protein
MRLANALIDSPDCLRYSVKIFLMAAICLAAGELSRVGIDFTAYLAQLRRF